MKVCVTVACHGRKGALCAWSFALVTSLLLCACGKVSGPTISDKPVERNWTEDVLLDDGATLLVKRYVKFKETDAWTGGAYNAVEWKSTIQFTGALAALPAWDQSLMALVMYRDASANEWVVVATTTDCATWSRRGKTIPPYWEFRLNDKDWRETPLSETSKGRRANLFTSYQPAMKSAHVSVADRNASNSNPMIDKLYVEIVTKYSGFVCGNQVRIGQ